MSQTPSEQIEPLVAWRSDGGPEIPESDDLGGAQHHLAARLTAGFRTHSSPERSWLPGIVVLPAYGFRPGDPCPDLLTEDEAVRYLRLDTISIKNPEASLRYYREKGQLRGTQVSKRVFYLRAELDRLLTNLTSDNPR
jgi:hypothetical protein